MSKEKEMLTQNQQIKNVYEEESNKKYLQEYCGVLEISSQSLI